MWALGFVWLEVWVGGLNGVLREQLSACERCTGRLRWGWVVMLVIWRLFKCLKCGLNPRMIGGIEEREWREQLLRSSSHDLESFLARTARSWS